MPTLADRILKYLVKIYDEGATDSEIREKLKVSRHQLV